MTEKTLIKPPQFCGLYWYEYKKTRNGIVYLAQATADFWELWERNANELKAGGFSVWKGTYARAAWRVRIFVGRFTTEDDFKRTFAAMAAVNDVEVKRQKAEHLAALENENRERKSRLLRRLNAHK